MKLSTNKIAQGFLVSLIAITVFHCSPKKPEILNLKQILQHFLAHRKTVVYRRTAFELRKAQERAHILEGLKIAITNLDGLDHVDPIRVCVAYRLNEKRLDVPPCDASQLANCEPVYEEVRGWNASTHAARKFSQLPSAARKYVRYISELTGGKLSMVSVGPTRGETITL